jgi:2-iminobutanoate/2-iminopropanoate deaminase
MTMPRQAINPDTLFNSTQYGFSQITVGQGSKIITLSGQVAWDINETLIGDDLASQVIVALENIQTGMVAAGGSLDDILSLRIYIKQSEMEDAVGIREGLQTFFPEDPPTSTWLAVPSLARPEFLVEIEAMGVLA